MNQKLQLWVRRGGLLLWMPVAMTLSGLGCARITIRRHSAPLPVTETVTEIVTERRDEYAWGLLNLSRVVDLRDRCPGGWETLTIEQRPLQILARVGTLGIYSPWTVTEACSAKR